MTTMDRWFSACARLICLLPEDGATRAMHSVFVFRARDRGSAFERALVLGRSLERDYLNEAGEEVRWRLAQIVTLDELQDDDLDGSEVFSEPADLRGDELVGYDSAFTPHSHAPTQSGV